MEATVIGNHHMMPESPETPARPTARSVEVYADAVDEIMSDVLDWCEAREVLDRETVNKGELKAVLVLAVSQSDDHYSAARYIDSFFEWPVDGELVNILNRVYLRAPFIATSHVRHWVWTNKVRFPADKGGGVTFRVGDATMQGKVVEVLAGEAAAIVLPMGRNPRHIRVLAEEVLDCFTVRGGKNSPGGNGNTVA